MRNGGRGKVGMRVSPPPSFRGASLHLVNEGRIEVLDASLTADFATTRRAISVVQSFFSRCRIIRCIHL